MILHTTLEKIEKEYIEKVNDILNNNGQNLSAELLVEISFTLFNEIKVKDISDSECEENDMLLFQYGTYDWGNEFGKHFMLDITRQFINPDEDEPYQLSFTLIYEPELFKDISAFNCWSDSYADINDFSAEIKTTSGFKVANKNIPKTFQIHFEQC